MLLPLPQYYELVGLHEAVGREERYDLAAHDLMSAHARSGVTPN